MEYAAALPALVKDNVGDAPLTVRPYASYSWFRISISSLRDSVPPRDYLGLDFDAPENHPNGGGFTVPEVDLEVFG